MVKEPIFHSLTMIDRFDENDKAGLECFAKILCEEIEKTEKEIDKSWEYRIRRILLILMKKAEQKW